MSPFIKSVLFGSTLCVVVLANESPPTPPWAASALTFETGVLWEIGTGTPFAYHLVPAQLSWRSAEFWHREYSDGTRLVLRHRLTLLVDLLQSGPESRYLGFSASPSLEWWNRSATMSLFAGIGGGFGLTDSRGNTGGLGQDFTLNWFIRGGIEQAIAPGRSVSAGLMYQHLSNGGMTTPNPSINALGFTLGYSWRY
ncbi:MAG: acyloxyacyl hydrolase [Candidatus Didemnitutus sp.]|nr:acyloxyacyl hydrolase [Candidatus Didemnitutus sp.]